jgi:hypothetical protein
MLAAADPGVSLPVKLEGDSLFGAFALGLMQSVLRAEPECVLRKNVHLTEAVKATCLQRIAVTARWDSQIGRFGPVEDIEKKIEALAMLGREMGERCAACVLDEGQSFPHPDRVTREKKTEIYVSEDGGRLALVRAYDPADAFAKLFELQARDVLGRFLQ